MYERQTIKVLAQTFSSWEFRGTLSTVMKLIREQIEVYGSDAHLEFNSDFHLPYDPDPSPRFELYVYREENDDEFLKRVAQEVQDAHQHEKREKAELERLIKKFGIKT